MKKLVCLLMLILSVNTFALSPSFFNGKTYVGEIIPEKGTSYAQASMIGELKLALKFKNSSQVDMVLIVVPSGYQMEALLKLGGVKDSDLVTTFPLKYKVEGDILKIVEDDGTSDFMIVRNGEAIIIDDGGKYGFTSVLTPYK